MASGAPSQPDRPYPSLAILNRRRVWHGAACRETARINRDPSQLSNAPCPPTPVRDPGLVPCLRLRPHRLRSHRAALFARAPEARCRSLTGQSGCGHLPSFGFCPELCVKLLGQRQVEVLQAFLLAPSVAYCTRDLTQTKNISLFPFSTFSESQHRTRASAGYSRTERLFLSARGPVGFVFANSHFHDTASC